MYILYLYKSMKHHQSMYQHRSNFILGVHAQRRLQQLGLCVCVSVKSHLTYGACVRHENAVTYSGGNEGQNICGDLPDMTAFKSYLET